MKRELKASLAHAEEKLRAAELLFEGGAWGDASSQAYDAAFHVVTAVAGKRQKSRGIGGWWIG